jgi:hypothetical protein
MMGVVSDNMNRIHELAGKVIDGPSVLPVNSAVCIPRKHDIYIGLINRKEAIDHIDGP